jgi:hypothetical protein
MNSCPDGFVCINNFHMIYISFISLVVLYLVINQYYKDIHEKIHTLKKEIGEERQKEKSSSSENKELQILKQKEKQLNKYQENLDKLSKKTQENIESLQQVDRSIPTSRDRDKAVLEDPLYPPLKRNYNMPDIRGIPINIQTRESAGDYQQIGILHKNENTDKSLDKPGNNDENVVLGLFGKRLYRGSTNWLYYIIAEKNNIKIPLIIQGVNCTNDDRGCKELYDGDSVSIPQYNGEFKVQLYRFDAPKYIPYVY